MKKYLLLLCLLPVIAGSAQTDAERLDQVMQAATNAGIFHGVALVARHDSILLFKGYGWRDYEHKVPHDTGSVFQVGSVTKQFTATLILWLRDQHRLSLDDKLSNYFPAYHYADKITIRNLLTHTSGIVDFCDPWFMEHEAFTAFSQKDFWNFIGGQGLDFDPGTEFSYSNSNYMLLGYIIEQVTGKPLPQVMRDVIFDKAGMRHSGFDFAHLKSPERSVGYDTLNEQVQQRARIEDSSATMGAGALYTTAGDLYRWNLALYTDKILSQASLQEAFTPHMGDYGYGWYIQRAGGIYSVAHAGGILGFQSYIKRFLGEHACVILLCNEILSFGDYATSLQRILYHEPNYYIPRKEIRLAPDSLQAYTGQFELIANKAFQGSIELTDGRLLLTWTKMDPQEIYPEKRDFFHFKVYNSQLDFSRDAHGQISGFTAVSGGQSYVYKKIQPAK